MLEWKVRIEKQLTEISDSVKVVQVPNQCTTFSLSASGEWENWFGSNELGNIPVDFPNWLENGDLVDMVPPEDEVPYPYQAAATKEKPSNIMVKIEPETTGQDPCQASLVPVNIECEQKPTGLRLHQDPPAVEKAHDDAQSTIKAKALGQDLCQAPSTGNRPSNNNPSIDHHCTTELELLREELAEVKR